MMNFRTMAATLAVLAMPLAFTSCDYDDPWDYNDYYGDWYDDYDWYEKPFDHGTSDLNYMAQLLRGHWQGTLRNYYTDDNGNRTYADMNVFYEFDQYDATSLNGRGVETDWVGDESQELTFSWYIDPRTGNINIKYDNSNMTFLLDANANEEFAGFYLDNKTFSGVMEGTNNDEQLVFDCSRTTVAAPDMTRKSDPTRVQRRSSGKEEVKMVFRKRK